MKPLISDDLITLLDSRDLNIRTLMGGLFGGNRRSARYGASAEFADFREYMPGDDTRRIDWNLYGRFDKLYLRLYADERRHRHQVMIDCSASMAWGRPEKRHYALQLAAVLGYLAVSGMDTVRYFSLEGSLCRPLGPTVATRDAWLTAADRLARLPCRGDTRLDQAIMSCPSPGRDDGTTFLISDLLTDSDWKAGVDWLLEKKRAVCLVQVLSPDEIDPMLYGKVRLLDRESRHAHDARNLLLEINGERLLAYSDAYEWMERDIQAFCDARGVRFLSCCTSEALSRLLFTRCIEAEIIQ